jgi:hypothetical protein
MTTRTPLRVALLSLLVLGLLVGGVGAQETTDLVFLVDGSGSISAVDWQLQKDGISAALRDARAFPLDGSMAVGVVQWSFVSSALRTRLELPLTVLDGASVRDAVIAQVQAMGQLGRLTNPGDGIRHGTQELLARGRNPALSRWILCMSTDGVTNSGELLASATAFAQASGVDKYSVIAIEDPPFFDAAALRSHYAPHVFGGGSVVVARNAIEFASLIAGACLGTPVELRALEVNQAVQDWQHAIPLIARKPTGARAFVQAKPGEPARNVVGRLFGTRDGVPLPGSPLLALNPGSAVLAAPDIVARRATLADSLNFRLPSSWLQGTIELEFEAAGTPLECLEPAGAGGDPAGDCKVTVTFQDEVRPEMVFIGVSYTEDDTTRAPTTTELFEQMWRFRSILPVEAINYRMDTLGPFTGRPALGDVNEALASKRMLDIFLCFVGCAAPTTPASRYYGVLQGAGGGLANGIPGTVSSGFLSGTGARSATGYARNRGPHELAHSLGRHHAVDNELGLDANGRKRGRCNEVASADAPGHVPFETVAGNIRPVLGPLSLGVDREVWGLDHRFLITNTNDLAVVDPRQTFEVLSYCGGGPQGRWISQFTYEGLIGAFPAPPRRNPFSPFQFVIVRGRVAFAEDTATLTPVLEFTGDAPAVLPGPYRVELLDAAGRELAAADFEPEVMDADAPEPEVPTDEPTGLILVPLPKPAPPIARIVVRRNGVVIGERLASPSRPSVGILSPRGGDVVTGDQVTFAWMGADPDGDPLTYTVSYSADGGTTWTTLAVDLTATTLTVPRGELGGSTEGRLLVVVSDGIHTDSALSEPFVVANNPPVVNIDLPRPGEVFTGVQVVTLEGTAFDREDGPLGGLAVGWFSDVDGFIGSGELVEVNAANFTEGTHQLTFVAVDSAGEMGSAGVTIHIFRIPPPPIVTVTVDIKPGEGRNPVNLRSRGVIPVAILTTSGFEARSVDPATVCFGPAADPEGRGVCAEAHGRGHLEDVNGDGLLDLVLRFRTQQTGLGSDNMEACVTGHTFDGVAFRGCDEIVVVGPAARR